MAKASTSEEKAEALGFLCRMLMNINLAEADKYGLQLIEVAEMSRNRKLMVKALLTNGERYSYLSGKRDNIDKAVGYYTQGLELAKKTSWMNRRYRPACIYQRFSVICPIQIKH